MVTRHAAAQDRLESCGLQRRRGRAADTRRLPPQACDDGPVRSGLALQHIARHIAGPHAPHPMGHARLYQADLCIPPLLPGSA